MPCSIMQFTICCWQSSGLILYFWLCQKYKIAKISLLKTADCRLFSMGNKIRPLPKIRDELIFNTPSEIVPLQVII